MVGLSSKISRGDQLSFINLLSFIKHFNQQPFSLIFRTKVTQRDKGDSYTLDFHWNQRHLWWNRHLYNLIMHHLSSYSDDQIWPEPAHCTLWSAILSNPLLTLWAQLLLLTARISSWPLSRVLCSFYTTLLTVGPTLQMSRLNRKAVAACFLAYIY